MKVDMSLSKEIKPNQIKIDIAHIRFTFRLLLYLQNPDFDNIVAWMIQPFLDF